MPSKAYKRALKEAQRHHADSKTYSGKLVRPHKPALLAIAREFGIASALDYGCGKGEQFRWVDPADGKTLEEAFGFEVAKYDPAWPPYAAEPEGIFHLVICTHVLGSIPVADLGWVLDRLYELGSRVVYVAEKIGPVKKRALSAPEERPVGWTPHQWMKALQGRAAPSVTTFFSARERIGDETRTRRWRFGPGCREWELVFDSSAGAAA